MKKINTNKFIYPVVIIVSAMIIGGSSMWVQYNKQESIERQQKLELTAEKEKEEAKAEKERKSEDFDNELKCQELLKDLKQRWNNVTGIRYSRIFNTCMVKYTKNGETEESQVENMKDTE